MTTVDGLRGIDFAGIGDDPAWATMYDPNYNQSPTYAAPSQDTDPMSVYANLHRTNSQSLTQSPTRSLVSSGSAWDDLNASNQYTPSSISSDSLTKSAQSLLAPLARAFDFTSGIKSPPARIDDAFNQSTQTPVKNADIIDTAVNYISNAVSPDIDTSMPKITRSKFGVTSTYPNQGVNQKKSVYTVSDEVVNATDNFSFLKAPAAEAKKLFDSAINAISPGPTSVAKIGATTNQTKSTTPRQAKSPNSFTSDFNSVIGGILSIVTPITAARQQKQQAKAGAGARGGTGSRGSAGSSGSTGSPMATYALIGAGVLGVGLLVYMVAKKD